MRISQLAKQTGFSLIEVLVAGLVMGTAIVGVSLMYGTGSSWVASTGDDRVASGLAQQQIEQIRAGGFPRAVQAGVPTMEPPLYPAGVPVPPDPSVRSFTRMTCIQFVDPTGLNTPLYTVDCPAGAEPASGNVETVRITVTVTANNPTTADSSVFIAQPNPVVLQAWLTRVRP